MEIHGNVSFNQKELIFVVIVAVGGGGDGAAAAFAAVVNEIGAYEPTPFSDSQLIASHHTLTRIQRENGV